MYRQHAFASTDLNTLEALIARDPFVTLLTPADGGLPLVSHLPVLFRRSGQTLVLEGHWARPNPQALHAGPAMAMAIVHGPHAYVSPSVYPDKHAAARVPTWNYAVAHLHGRLEHVQAPEPLADLVGRQSAHFEALAGHDWRLDAGQPAMAAKLRGIVGFVLTVERVALTLKLNQNHPLANVQAVADDLERRGGPAEVEIAALMRAQATA